MKTLMDSLGLLETATIAGGVRVLDVMLKAADVVLLCGTTICSGRYMIQLNGSRDAVATSMDAAKETGEKIVANALISGVASEVFSALKQQQPFLPGNALGLIECRKSVPSIKAADVAVKNSSLILNRLTLASGINGKSYLVVSGSVADVRSGVEAATAALGRELLDGLVLPSPDPQLVTALVKTRGQILC